MAHDSAHSSWWHDGKSSSKTTKDLSTRICTNLGGDTHQRSMNAAHRFDFFIFYFIIHFYYVRLFFFHLYFGMCKRITMSVSPGSYITRHNIYFFPEVFVAAGQNNAQPPTLPVPVCNLYPPLNPLVRTLRFSALVCRRRYLWRSPRDLKSFAGRGNHFEIRTVETGPVLFLNGPTANFSVVRFFVVFYVFIRY